MQTSKYFEILSHQIRYSILTFIDVNQRSYVEILDGISSDESEIKSNKLNFHLKKMVDEGIIVKIDKSYSLSELGMKLLSLIYQLENIDSSKLQVFPSIEKTEMETIPSVKTSLKKDLPIIKKLDGIPPLVSVFEYFEGKHYEYMEEKYFIELPDPISIAKTPIEWIIDFVKNIKFLLDNEKAKEWVIDRYLKLGYGTRGLQDYGLMDASLSVPPLDSFFNSLIELLTLRGKAGLYAKTGMGKSRMELYVASYWIRKYKTPIFYIQNPHYLQVKDYEKLHDVLSRTGGGGTRGSPKYLVIFEDAHLTDNDQLNALIKIISGASNKTYSVLVSFTDMQILNNEFRSETLNFDRIEQLRKELIPEEYTGILDLNKHWDSLRPYFQEWIKWVAADILFDFLPKVEIKKDNLTKYSSPWSFVVSLGFLKGALGQLEKSSTINSFPLVLYHFLALMYIMRDEKDISLSSLKSLFNIYLKTDLKEAYGPEWEVQMISLLNNWTDPMNRLLPPFKYQQQGNMMVNESYIYFYHIEWANEVCKILDSSSKQLKDSFDKFLSKMFPILRKIWELLEKNMPLGESFVLWLRTNVRYDMSSKNELVLASLTLDTNQKKALKGVTISDSIITNIKQSEMVNCLFIKSVINS